MNKTIIVSGLTEEQQTKLNALAKAENIQCRAVKDTQTTLTVAQLLDDRNLPENDTFKIDGKFAMLSGFENNEREGTALINQVDPTVIKAVRTPYNSGWKFKDLCSEILKENTAIQNRKEKN